MVDTLSPSCSVSVDETVGSTDSDSDILIAIVIDKDPSPSVNAAHTSGSEPKEVASEGTPLESKHVVQPDKVGRDEMFEQKQVARVVGSRLCCYSSVKKQKIDERNHHSEVISRLCSRLRPHDETSKLFAAGLQYKRSPPGW
jgi:hypothetical protein